MGGEERDTTHGSAGLASDGRQSEDGGVGVMIVGLMGGDCRVREGGCCYCHCFVVEGRWLV